MKPQTVLLGENEPLSNKIILVNVKEVPNGISDGLDLEKALRDLKKETDDTGRVVTMVQIYVTNNGPDSLIYTIMAQWIGRITLEDVNRRAALQGMNQTPGTQPLRSLH